MAFLPPPPIAAERLSSVALRSSVRLRPAAPPPRASRTCTSACAGPSDGEPGPSFAAASASLASSVRSGLAAALAAAALVASPVSWHAHSLAAHAAPAQATAQADAPLDLSIDDLIKLRKLFDEALDLTNAGNFEQAEKVWTEIIGMIPDRAEGYSNRGNARTSQNKLELALRDYTKAIELEPGAVDPHLNRGVALEGLARFDEAITEYDTALELDPKDAVAWNNRGNAQAGLGRWEAALADYNRATELAKDFVFARANYALALYETGQRADAAGIMRGLTAKYQGFADMEAALAAALAADGRLDEADRHWEAALRADARYSDLSWLAGVRRWPPAIFADLESFLSLSGTVSGTAGRGR